MTFEAYEKKFRDKASNAGYSEEDIIKCLHYAEPLINRNLPVIYNTSNLCGLVGYRKSYVKRAALFTNFFYRSFSIKKRNGKLRQVNEPLPSLKEIQTWILKNILYEIPVSKFAKAYIPNRDILDNVRFHRNKTKVLSVDIKDFFSSINRSSIEEIFRQVGYSSNVSNLLSKLCCYNERLPQGAPTSAYLSNIYLINFDKSVSEYCIKHDIRYTRYADDIVCSGDFNELPLIEYIRKELETLSLTLNESKTKVMTQDMRQLVTGIIVNEKIQLPKGKRKEIRQEVYYIKKFGLQQHLRKTQNNKANYIPHLLGKINYSLYVNPNDKEMQEYKNFILSI